MLPGRPRRESRRRSYKLSHGYTTLPRREREKKDTVLKTRNANARARIAKVMNRLYDDD